MGRREALEWAVAERKKSRNKQQSVVKIYLTDIEML
jgi:hypothetical protein